MDVALDGEIVRKLKPVFGYLHRNHEKIGENTSYLGSMPYTDRLDYFCSMTNNWAYALSVEKLAGIEVPERAEYLRVILAELTRLQNHASLLGFLLRTWARWGTPLMYAFREREKILDLFESLSGSRMMCNYMRFGGCRVRSAAGLDGAGQKACRRLPAFLDEFEKLIVGNEILIARTQNVGKLSAELAINAGITGPMLRACGRQLRHSQSGRLRILSAFQIPHSARRTRRHLRPLHDARARNARERRNFEAGVRANSGRTDHESESEDPRLSSAGGRSVRTHRSAQGRARFLFDQRRRHRIRIVTVCARRVSST